MTTSTVLRVLQPQEHLTDTKAKTIENEYL